MMKTLRKIIRHDNGATAIEYGLIAGLIAVVIIAGATLTGENVGGALDEVGTALDTSE